MEKLGVFYTCFDELEATHFSISMLRKNYPNIPICLFYESNEKFDYLYNYFKNIQINKVEDTMSETLKVTVHNFRNPDKQIHILNGVKAILDRLEKAIGFCNSEYIIMLDPDAIVRGKLTIPENSSLLGCRQNTNPMLLNDMNSILKRNGGVEITAWGATPAIFNVEKFKKAKSKLINTPNLLKELSNSFYAIFAHDILMAILFSLIGEVEQFNPDIVQCSKDPLWIYNNKPLIHQFRFFYPKRKTKYAVGQW